MTTDRAEPNSSPLVSVVICTFNRKQLLHQALASAFAQTYRPVEIVVLDDGSTDGTARMMKQYADQVRYIRQENQGIARARTNACRLAQGEFIAFLDDDDLMPTERIATLLRAFHSHPSAVLAVGDWAEIDNQNNLTGRRWLQKKKGVDLTPYQDGYTATLWPHLPVVTHTTLFRKADGDRIGWFDHRYRYAAEDKDFFARLTKLGAVVHVSNVVSYYRRGQSSLTSSRPRVAASQVLFYIEQLRQLPESEREHQPLCNRLKSRLLRALKILASDRYNMESDTQRLSSDVHAEAMGLLNFGMKLEYYYFVTLKHPLKHYLNKQKSRMHNSKNE